MNIEMSDSQEFATAHDSKRQLVSTQAGSAPAIRETRNILDDKGESSGICGVLLYVMSVLLCIITMPFSLLFIFKVVRQYEKVVIFRLGKVNAMAAGPGLFTFLPCTDRLQIVDMRTFSFDIPPQEILTKDSVTVQVDGVIYYRINNAVMSVCNVDNVNRATRLLSQTTLRNMLGVMTLTEILMDRDVIAHTMQDTLDKATDPWGVKVERVEVKDVRLPLELQRAMAAEAEATREAKAKVIAAEGELNASRALKEAADVISQSPAALQLRYLQTLTSISTEQNSTILFPMPIDMTSAFVQQ